MARIIKTGAWGCQLVFVEGFALNHQANRYTVHRSSFKVAGTRFACGTLYGFTRPLTANAIELSGGGERATEPRLDPSVANRRCPPRPLQCETV